MKEQKCLSSRIPYRGRFLRGEKNQTESCRILISSNTKVPLYEYCVHAFVSSLGYITVLEHVPQMQSQNYEVLLPEVGVPPGSVERNTCGVSHPHALGTTFLGTIRPLNPEGCSLLWE